MVSEIDWYEFSEMWVRGRGPSSGLEKSPHSPPQWRGKSPVLGRSQESWTPGLPRALLHWPPWTRPFLWGRPSYDP